MDPESLSSEQREVLEKFRQQLSDVLRPNHDDFYLTRWLIARSWNIDKAEAMLRANLKWRKLQDMDNILETWKVPEVLKLYLPGGVCGVDKSGSPVWIERVGQSDTRGLFASVRVNELFRNQLHRLEKIQSLVQQQKQQTGRHPGGLIAIQDCEGFGLKHLWKPGMDFAGEMSKVAESNFPEMLKTCFVINAPKIFLIAYNILKPFFQERTKQKIKFLGSNWRETLLEYIDADQLPVHWGGTQTDPDGDPYCRSKIPVGGEVPQSYYNNEHAQLDRTRMTEAVVRKGSSLKVEQQVEVPESVISWQFLTESHDIGFGIYQKCEDKKREDSEQIVMSIRVNSHQIPESGCVLAPECGTYVARFDNTYSWLNSKKLYYSVEVLPPGKETDKHCEPSSS